jgi:deoxyribonuclease IV
MSQIKFGPAGIGGFKEASSRLEMYNKLGIRCAEIPFTYQVWLTNYQSEVLAESIKKYDIAISIHAPYYINLNSQNKKKTEASIKRILLCCERAHYLQARYVVFHAAFYGGKSAEQVYEIVKSKILEMQQVISKNNWHVKLAPETTGKISQFGSLSELLRLHKETGCFLCIDFAHLRARQGKIDYQDVFKKIKEAKLDNLHCHFSGIEFGDKGELRHLVTEEKDLHDLLEHLKKSGLSANIINESPSPVEDSIKGIKILKSLK